jgi:O-antigen/teichoic acid export membrane protein
VRPVGPTPENTHDRVDESPPLSEPMEVAGPATADPSAPAYFGLRTFALSAGLLSITAVSNVIRAIITAKLLAVTLGPSTTGVLAQILNFSALLFQIIPLGLTTGVAKLVADSPADRSRVGAVLGTSSALSLASATVCLIVMAPFSAHISQVLTGSERYAFAVLLILLSLPLYNVAGALSYVLQGLADIRRLTIANVATAAGSLIVLIPATIAFGLVGATAAVAVASILQFAFFTFAVWRAFAMRQWSLSVARLSWATAKPLLHYGGVLLVAGLGAWGSLLMVRTIGIHSLGALQNGIYQVVNGISAQYMAVFIAWMAAYVFPRVVAEKDPARTQTLLNSVLRANLLIMGSGMVATIALRELVVRLLYSPAFSAAAPILPIQVLGDYGRVIGWSFGLYLFARGRTMAYLLAMLSQDLLWIAISPAAMQAFGTAAIAMGYSLSSLAWPILMYPMVRRWFGVRIDRDGAVLSIVGLGAIAGAILLPGLPGLVLAAALPVTAYLLRPDKRIRLLLRA